jgi:hypothetical protein
MLSSIGILSLVDKSVGGSGSIVDVSIWENKMVLSWEGIGNVWDI